MLYFRLIPQHIYVFFHDSVTNKMKKSVASLNKAAAPSDQYQIDAGQKVMGPKECPTCNMIYDIGDPVDEKRHAAYHEKRYELKYKVIYSSNF